LTPRAKQPTSKEEQPTRVSVPMRAFLADRTTFKADRMIVFSDAVMAVAITLLVLDLKLPEGVTDAGLAGALQGSLHALGVYVLSFIVIGLLWMGHHQQFSYIRRVDGVMLWLNLFFLMTIGLIPFVTSLLSDHGSALATSLYAGTLVMTSLLSAAMWWYAGRDPELMPQDVSASVRREGLLTPLLLGAVFAMSIVIAVLWSVTAAQLSWLLLIPAGRIPALLDN
jgi:TMEM175 potassium channel family protein